MTRLRILAATFLMIGVTIISLACFIPDEPNLLAALPGVALVLYSGWVQGGE